MKLIIDGDHVVYRAAASCEPTKKKLHLEDKSIALYRANDIMQGIFKCTRVENYELYIKGEGNWRTEIYPDYKANRVNMKSPTWLEDVREYLITEYGARITNGREVDDMCGIRLTKLNPNRSLCVSLDKDLLQVPGYHYNFVTNTFTPVDTLAGLGTFYKSVITGDQVDNIPAFDGKFRNSVPKFVQKLLDPIDEMEAEEEMYHYCMDVYESWSGNPLSDKAMSTMHRNASVLYVQRKEGDMWRPPNTNQDWKLKLPS